MGPESKARTLAHCCGCPLSCRLPLPPSTGAALFSHAACNTLHSAICLNILPLDVSMAPLSLPSSVFQKLLVLDHLPLKEPLPDAATSLLCVVAPCSPAVPPTPLFLSQLQEGRKCVSESRPTRCIINIH